MRFTLQNTPLRYLLSFILISLLLASHATHAADIARDLRAGREDETIENDGYVEVSFSGILNKMPTLVLINWLALLA